MAAQPTVISDADQATARGLYEEGLALFDDEHYTEAMERFGAAYALDPSPALLYNLARAAEENGVADAAVAHYRTYLDRYPGADDRPEVERRIRILDAVLRDARRGTIAVLEAPAGARVLINEKPAGDADTEGNWRREPGTYALKVESDVGSYSTRVEVRPGELTTVSWAEAPGERGSELTIAGWSTVGTGALLAATGFLFWSEANDAADTWQAAVRDISAGDTTPSAQARKRRAEQDVAHNGDTARLLWGLGGAAVAAGAGILLYDTFTEAPAPTASLIVLPQGVGVSGQF